MRLLYGTIAWLLITSSCIASSTCNDKELQLRMFNCVDPAAGRYPTYIITDPDRSGTLTVLDQDSNLISNITIAFDGKSTEVNYLELPNALSGQMLTLYYTSMDGCIIEQSELFTVAPSFSITKEDPTSYGSTDGTIQIDVIKSTTEVLWSDGTTGYTRSDLAAGNYSVTITGASNCTDEVTITLTGPAELKAVHKPTIVQCNGEIDHLYKAYASGGVPPYDYIWTVDGIVQPLNDPTIHFVNSNNVSLVVRDNLGNVTHSTLVDTGVTINSVLLDAVAIPALRVSGSGEDIYDLSMALDVEYGDADNDKGDGSIYDITYHETMQAAMSNTSAMNTSVVSSTPATYYLRAQSKNNCFDVAPLSLLPTSYCLAVSEACDTDTPIELRPRDCSRDANPLPGGGSFRIFRRLQPANDLGPEVPEALIFINGVAHFDPDNREGNFLVQYTYNDGAQDITATAFFDVQSVNPSLFIDRDTVCGNDLEVLMLANPVGGTLVGTGIIDSYTSGTNQAFLIDPQMLEVNQNHDFTYRYSNTNQSGLVCFQNATEVLHVQDYPRIGALAEADAQCEGTSVTQEISVINPDIISSYTWTLNGDTISTSPNLHVPSIILSSVFSFTATSFNGCTSQDQVEVMVNPTPTLACELTAAVTCPGGDDAFATVEIIGVSDYSTYEFRWSNGATSETATGLSAGTYTVTVTDANGCIDSCSVEVTEPLAFDILCDFNIQQPACAGGSDGSTEVNVLEGGTPPYSYSRDNIVFNTTNTIAGYASGPQIVYVRDALGCVDSCSFNIPETVPVACNIDDSSVQGVSCTGGADGRATVAASGGTGSYTYLWDNGEMDATAVGLDAGNHSVVVTDSNGCSTVCNVTITEPTLLSCILQVQSPISCNAGDDGSATVVASGGTMPYGYLWSNGASTAIAGDLSQGTYSVTVTDANDCTTTCTIDLQEPLPLTASIEPAGVCQGDMVELTVDVDSRVVTHSWSITSPNDLGAVLHQTNQVTVKVDAMQAQPGVITLTYVGLDPNDCLVETTVDLDIQAAPTAGADEQTTICNTDITEYVVDLTSLLSLGATANGSWTYIGPMPGPDLSDPQAVSFECLAAGAYPFTYSVAPVDLCPGQEATITVNVEDCFDLAIRKTIDTRVLTSLDEPVIFDIEVFNQGRVTAHEVTITDYIEEEFIFDPAKNTGTSTGNNHDWEPSGQNAELLIGTIPPHSSVLVQIRLDVNPTFQEEELYNSAEITNYGIASVSGAIKLLPPDEDDFATPPPNRDDEIDDEIDDDSTGGEDDDDDDDQFDFAIVTLCGGSATQLNCNDLVNVSLDAQCEALITPNMLLEGQHTSRYRIELRDAEGNLLPNPLTAEHIDMSIEAKVIDDCSPNSCWSTVTVEDKFAPEIVCVDDITVSCLEPGTPFNIPPAIDGCEGPVDVIIESDSFDDTLCDSGLRGIRTVSYYAQDNSGNRSETCTFTISYDSIAMDDIFLESSIVLECDNQGIWDTNDNYYPEPWETQIPSVNGVNLVSYLGSGEVQYDNHCKVNVTYEDVTHDICENSYNLVRRWSLLNWCSGDLIELTQVILVTDTKAPQAVAPEDNHLIVANDSDCTGDYVVEDPVIVSECGSTTYTVSYLLADQNGQPPADGLYIDDNVVTLPDGRYVIRDLPSGQTWVRYTIHDGCGNRSFAFTEVIVVDETSPTAVCDEFTTVTLTSSGVGRINASTFDDGSHDNCSDDLRFEARRIQAGCGGSTAFSDHVTFCCNDVAAGEIMVEFRVWDDANGNGVYGDEITVFFDSNGSGILGDVVRGEEDFSFSYADNSSTCMVSVEVQDKAAPTITCPDDLTIACGTDYSDLSITGEAVAFDNCSADVITITDMVDINQCGVGTVVRTFTTRDQGQLVNSCRQTITIENFSSFDFDDPADLKYPEDVTLAGCIGNGYDISQTGEPVINADDCDMVAFTFSDQIFPLADTACFKVLRTFTVIDWCQFDQSQANVGTDSYVQTIYVQNSTAPTISNCQDTTICIQGDNCDGMVTIAANASDDCSAPEHLQYVLRIDADANGTEDYSFNQSSVDLVLTPGIYRVYWQVADRCGNTNTCSYIMTVQDCKAPSPYCRSEIRTVVMPSSGSISATAADFDLGSSDNCDGPLTFSFDREGQQLTREFGCNDLGLNILEIWVTDQQGNASYCEAMIDIQANHDCDASLTGTRIIGSVQSDVNTALSDVEVRMIQASGGESYSTITDSSGGFAFVDLDPGSYKITAKNDRDHSKGVSTLDLVLIQRHILGIADLDSPYKMLAADVNNSQSISGADIVDLRRLILGITDRFEHCDSWIFRNSRDSTVLSHPWSATGAIDLDIALDSAYQVSMTGIKMGDVNSSYSTELSNRSSTPIVLEAIKDNSDTGIGLSKISISSPKELYTSGYQMTVSYDASCYTFIGITGMAHSIRDHNYYEVEMGKINLAVALEEVTYTEGGQSLFTLDFRKISGDTDCAITIDHTGLTSELYDDVFTTHPISLVLRDGATQGHQVSVLQNVPNPFSNETQIEFYLPEDDYVDFTVYDITGTVVHKFGGQYFTGFNTININGDQLNSRSGTFYYQITTNGVTITKRMLLIQ